MGFFCGIFFVWDFWLFFLLGGGEVGGRVEQLINFQHCPEPIHRGEYIQRC